LGTGRNEEVVQSSGFDWQDDDSGGVQSLDWIEEARRATDPDVREAALRRLLDSNIDDVMETVAVRRWLESVK